MPVYTCACNARYRFADEAVGKRAKCRQCGRTFILTAESEIIAIAEEPDAPRAGHSVEGVADEGAAAAMAALGRPSAVLASGPAAAEERPRSFTADFLSLPLFLWRLGNAMTFLAVTFIYALGRFTPTWIAVFFIAWYCAYLFQVIEESAGGENDLPELTPTSDFLAEIFGALLKWIGSWFLAAVPALTTLSVGAWLGTPIPDGLWLLLSGDVVELIDPGMKPVEMAFVAATGLGLFSWPMLVLCIGLGCFESQSRLDLIVASVFRTLGTYTLTVALVMAARMSGPLWAAFGSDLVGRLLAAGLMVYINIIAMRAIGLYYFHSKGRFAWSWD